MKKLIVSTLILMTMIAVPTVQAESLFTLGASQHYQGTPRSLFGGVQAFANGTSVPSAISGVSSNTMWEGANLFAQDYEDDELKGLQGMVSLRKSELELIKERGGSLDEQNEKQKQIQAAIVDVVNKLKNIGGKQEDINQLATEWYSIQSAIEESGTSEKESLEKETSLRKSELSLLEAKGASVDYAIHPVAGRMPGHMNVLLAEANVDYEHMLEMDVANPMFAETDLVVVIGANDVVNPAANTAEGTPIYGMPILQIDKAKNIIICNFDDKPGYAGVPNPLYTNDDVLLLLGDANDSLAKLLAHLR